MINSLNYLILAHKYDIIILNVNTLEEIRTITKAHNGIYKFFLFIFIN